MRRVLLIEDDPIMGESLLDRFSLEGFTARLATRVAEAAELMAHERFDVVVSDVRLPDGSGETLFESLSARDGAPPWLFITAFASVDRAVAMLQAGARDYVTKPFDIAELIGKVHAVVGPPTPEIPGRTPAPNPLGVSESMRRLALLAERVAARARTVLITGESGSGKEVLARYVHALADPEARTPFVAVNCGAIPEALIEAALFGHERGAFTGAERARKGYLEQADGGTLFLDEVAELTPAMQVRLLRVLQERRVQRLGAEVSTAVQFRLVCATHRDLAERVRAGSFREDLYYRINVVHLRVPPLRERVDDVLWLAERFLQEQAEERSESMRRLSTAARARLLTHTWPGNVRELRNRIESAVVLREGQELHASDLFEEATPEPHFSGLPTLEQFLAAAERDYVSAVLERTGGRVGEAAQALGISRKTVWEKSRRYGLRTGEAAQTSDDGA
jgi:DNA-binding NtrC family response regulator